MNNFEALLLGAIQGLTEFLPVSSSGHLEIAKELFGFDGNAKQSMLFTVVLHFATALSTIVVFRKDIWEIIRALFAFKWNEETQFIVKIIISMIPAATVGVLLEDQIDEMFSGNLLLVGSMLIVTACLLYMANRAKDTNKPVGFIDSFIIGVAQAVAIAPGISRSGATISTSVLLGNDKTKAARFSFLMVVPLIFGKVAKDLLDDGLALEHSNSVHLALGFMAAFITGLFACQWMIKLVRRSKLSYFAIYCFVIGLLAIASQVMF